MDHVEDGWVLGYSMLQVKGIICVLLLMRCCGDINNFKVATILVEATMALSTTTSVMERLLRVLLSWVENKLVVGPICVKVVRVCCGRLCLNVLTRDC